MTMATATKPNPLQDLLWERAAAGADEAAIEAIRAREQIAPLARRRCAEMLDALSLDRPGLAIDLPPAI